MKLKALFTEAVLPALAAAQYHIVDKILPTPESVSDDFASGIPFILTSAAAGGIRSETVENGFTGYKSVEKSSPSIMLGSVAGIVIATAMHRVMGLDSVTSHTMGSLSAYAVSRTSNLVGQKIRKIMAPQPSHL